MCGHVFTAKQLRADCILLVQTHCILLPSPCDGLQSHSAPFFGLSVHSKEHRYHAQSGADRYIHTYVYRCVWIERVNTTASRSPSLWSANNAISFSTVHARATIMAITSHQSQLFPFVRSSQLGTAGTTAPTLCPAMTIAFDSRTLTLGRTESTGGVHINYKHVKLPFSNIASLHTHHL